jgi:hypothetical protein
VYGSDERQLVSGCGWYQLVFKDDAEKVEQRLPVTGRTTEARSAASSAGIYSKTAARDAGGAFTSNMAAQWSRQVTVAAATRDKRFDD